MTTISVLTPTYNGRLTVCRAIDSALSQHGVDVEVCVVDDASTDGTWALLQSTYADEPRVKLARLPENTSGIGALRHAADMATGEYVIRLDHDDWYADGALEGLAAALAANPRSFVYGQVKYWGRISQVFVPVLNPDFNQHNASLYPYMFPRAAFADCAYHAFRAGASAPVDWDFALQLIEHGYTPNPQPGIMVLHYVSTAGTAHDQMQARMAEHMAEMRERHAGVMA